MKISKLTAAVAVALTLVLVGGIVTVTRTAARIGRTNVVGYFDNSNGIYVGDHVVIRGVPVGEIERIEPEPDRVKISFWYDSKHPVPADAKAVILSPTLITARAIQLTPAYSAGPVMKDDATIPQNRTAVPVEWDDLRVQLEKLTETLQPTEPGGVSTLGGFVSTAADNLRGEGTNIRDSLTKLSRALSALGDHSDDLFSSIKNLSTLVSALENSDDLLTTLNQNLASATRLVANDPNEVGNAIRDLSDVADDATKFVVENREALGVTSDKLASVSNAVVESLDDIKQALHVFPSTAQNFVNIYQPAQGTLTGILAANNFANPVQFLCGAIQAASQLGAEQSAKLCVQYLAPIIKNRQLNFPPLGMNPFVGATARPNELTYSEDWLRPDYIPPTPPPAAPTALPAEEGAQASPHGAAVTESEGGLRGMMMPQGAGQ
ncbi:mammalian cell entry protein [Mycobacterium holsaticum DSM 44478]|nr:mammalian cell entry protein [Mycolicibacterium holsaticum DSM 44478 = JCM 12374]